MTIIFTNEPLPESFEKSLFLAGPTPRSNDVKSWRPEALRILEEKGYDGVVFVPESRDGQFSWSYAGQVEWEDKALNMADSILFWIPRNLATLPALTTNHEHGEWFKSGKIVLGAPPDAPKTDYLRFKAKQMFVPQFLTLEETIDEALKMVGKGVLRQKGECQVPLYIWQTGHFQNWYQNQLKAGNRLDGAKVEWTFRVGADRKIVFFWILHVNVFIAKENRNKINEIVLGRPDIAVIMVYKREKIAEDSSVILIREFRSPVSNDDGYVWELPGGSSFKFKSDVCQLAANELYEETGLKIDPSRIKIHTTRQIVATLSAHKACLFCAEITDEELEFCRQQTGIAHGVIEDSERTYIEIKTVKEIMQKNLVDWSMLGMILSVIYPSTF